MTGTGYSGEDGSVKVFKLGEGGQLKLEGETRGEKEKGRVKGLSWSHVEGGRLLASLESGSVLVWELRGNSVRETFYGRNTIFW